MCRIHDERVHSAHKTLQRPKAKRHSHSHTYTYTRAHFGKTERNVDVVMHSVFDQHYYFPSLGCASAGECECRVHTFGNQFYDFFITYYSYFGVNSTRFHLFGISVGPIKVMIIDNYNTFKYKLLCPITSHAAQTGESAAFASIRWPPIGQIFRSLFLRLLSPH